MGERETKTPRKWTRQRVTLTIVATISAVIVLIPCVRLLTLFVRARGGQAELERQLERIRSRGEPAAFERLAPPPVPEEENAAPGLVRALELLDADRASEPEGWEECLKGPFEPQHATLTVLDLHVEAMALAREALKRPHCQFDFDYSAATDTEFPHLAATRHLARLFAAQALLHAHTGQPQQAMQDLEYLFSLLRATEAHPLLIPKLVGLAIAGLGLDALQEIERTAPLPETSRRRLMDLLGRFDFHGEFAHAMLGERLLARVMLPSYRQELSSWRRSIARYLQRRDEAKVLALMTELVEASRLPSHKLRTALESMKSKTLDRDYPYFSAVTGLLLPPLGTAHLRHIETDARCRTSRISLALELHRSNHARYPDTLDALVPEFLPELPPDPFTGEPFVYRRRADGQGFIVYSVGENLTDDGGVEDEKSGKDDIVWERRPPGERGTDATDE